MAPLVGSSKHGLVTGGLEGKLSLSLCTVRADDSVFERRARLRGRSATIT